MVHAAGQGIYAGKSCCWTLSALLGQEPLLMWTQKAEVVATSDHYFITNASTTTNLAVWAFAQTEQCKKKKKSNFNTRNYYMIGFFPINKEYRNTLIDSLVLNFPIWPLKSCLWTQGLQVHLSSSIRKSSIKFMPPFQRADLWYPFSPWVMIIKLEQRF